MSLQFVPYITAWFISSVLKVKVNPNLWRKLTRGKQLAFLFVYCFHAKFSSRKRNITVLWKRLLIFECDGVLKLKKVQNNRGLVQRYQWSWKIHSCSRLLSNTTVTTKQNRENYSLNNNYALLQGFLGGILFTTPGKSVWSCHWIHANCKKVKIKNEWSCCYVY